MSASNSNKPPVPSGGGTPLGTGKQPSLFTRAQTGLMDQRAIAAVQGPKPSVFDQELAKLQSHQAVIATHVATAQDQVAQSMDTGMPFEQVSLDLSGADPNLGITTSVSFSLDRPGVALIYRRAGSAPGGKLYINAGGVFRDFSPGERIEGPFNRVEILLSPTSVTTGVANLVVQKRQDCRFVDQVLPAADSNGYTETRKAPFEVVADVTSGNQTSTWADNIIYDVSKFRQLRYEVKLLAAAGGASNTVTPAFVDSTMNGDAAATYGSGTVTYYGPAVTMAAPFMGLFAGVGLPNGAAAGNGGQWQMMCLIPVKATTQFYMTGNTTSFNVRYRILGFY